MHHHHRIRSRFQKPAVSALHLCQVRFRILAHTDVPDRRGHQDSVSAFERAEHDFNGKLASILPPPVEFDPSSDLLRQRFRRAPCTVRDKPFREALGNNILYLLPYQLVAAISKLLLRLDVQQNDFPGRVHHHHRIRSRFQQPAVSALHLCQVRFRILADADVADRRSHQDSLDAFERAEHDLNRKLASILPPRNEFDSCSDLLRQRFRCASVTVRD